MVDSSPENGAEESPGARRLYEVNLRFLPREERIVLARTSDGDTLEALCFDPDASVVVALFDNLHAALAHARLVARHHRTPPGLEALAQKMAFARDAEVQRRLLQNPQSSEALLRRLLAGRALLQLHPLTLSRELSERARRCVREALRLAFTRAEAEEKVRLLVQTEGRCLMGLAGLPLGQKAASLLCGVPVNSSLLVQNLGTWPATPPNVLEHLLRQPLVMRAPHLRQVLLRHPNCPSRLKKL